MDEFKAASQLTGSSLFLAERDAIKAEAKRLQAELAVVKQALRDESDRSLGFDRRGPHADGSRPERGFACTCSWGSRSHGDTCPEHGYEGVVVLSRAEKAEAELADLRSLVIQPWTRDDGAQLFKVNLAWWDSAASMEEAEAMVAEQVKRLKAKSAKPKPEKPADV